MSFDMNPADDDPHAECANEIHRLQAALTASEATCRRLRELVATWRGRDDGLYGQVWSIAADELAQLLDQPAEQEAKQ